MALPKLIRRMISSDSVVAGLAYAAGVVLVAVAQELHGRLAPAIVVDEAESQPALRAAIVYQYPDLSGQLVATSTVAISLVGEF